MQLEGYGSPRGFSYIEKGKERALHEECSYKKVWSPRRFSSIERAEERALNEECGYKKVWSPRSSPLYGEKGKEHHEKSAT